MITKVALDRLSRSLHSDVCDSDKCGDAVACSRISGRGNRRLCAVPNNNNNSNNHTDCDDDTLREVQPLHPTSFHLFLVGGKDRAKIRKLTLDALNTRQSLVKGERLVRHEMRAVLPLSTWWAHGVPLRTRHADNGGYQCYSTSHTARPHPVAGAST
jgi:hypothetical protein